MFFIFLWRNAAATSDSATAHSRAVTRNKTRLNNIHLISELSKTFLYLCKMKDILAYGNKIREGVFKGTL